MESYPTNALPAPVLSCDCGDCDDYLAQDNGDLACGKCGCLPISHKYMTSQGERTDSADSEILPRLPLLSQADISTPNTDGKKKKRPLGELGKGLTTNPFGEPVKKKAKIGNPLTTGSTETGLFHLKPCKILQRSHLPFTEIGDIPNSTRGVYKVAYNYKTIYVGNTSCYIRQTLRSHFSGNGQKDLYEFIKSLRQKDLEKVSVFWLDENKYVHNCSKKSYLKCIEEEEGAKPQFNTPVAKKTSSSRWCSIS